MQDDALDTRLEKLERSNRTLRLFAALPSLACLTMILLAMQGPPAQDTIRAKKIVTERIEVIDKGDAKVTISPLSIDVSDSESQTFVGRGFVNVKGPGLYGVELLATPDEAHIHLNGPSAPGEQNPWLDVASEETRKAEAGKPFPSRRLILSHRVGCSSITLLDSRARQRATLGAQRTKSGDGRSTEWPESTLTLWGETGKLETMLPGK